MKVFDIKTNAYVKTVFEHPKYDVSGVFTDTSTGKYAGAWYIDDKIKFVMRDSSLQGHFDYISQHFGDEKNILIVDMANNNQSILFVTTGPNDSGTYHLYDTNTQKIEYVGENNRTLNQNLNSKSVAMSVPMRDGTFIQAYHTYPANTESLSDLPLIVMPHGGPESRDYLTFHPWVQYFVSRNFQVVQMNFRGSSGYGRSFSKAGYGEWGGLMHTDLTDTVRHFYDKGLSSPAKTCIVGYSYGGYAALYAGAKTPELYSCIVSGGGLSDLLLDLKDHKNEHGKNSESYEYWLKSIGNPKTDKAKLASISPRNLAEQFKAPV